MIDLQTTVADMVLEHSECASVFQRHHIDFCCKGHITIEAAIGKAGVAPAALVQELTRAISDRNGDGDRDFRAMTTSDLVAHIVSKHHTYLRQTLPFVQSLAAKVSRVHGEHDPALREIDRLVSELSDALLPHLDVEEETLFPALQADPIDRKLVDGELSSMQKEHLGVARLLERIRMTAKDFELPKWACRSYRALFAQLERIESDVFKHVHLENHVLLPRFGGMRK